MRRTMVLAGLLLAGCGSDHDLPVAGPSPTFAAHEVTVDRGQLSTATLELSSGVTDLHITTSDLHGRLVRATTPAASGQTPAVTLASGGTVDVQLSSTGGGGPSVLDLGLDSGVTWTLRLDGGATTEDIDMSGGHLTTVDLGAGATRVSISLPVPSGTQTVHEGGGASELTLTRPAHVATRVHAIGGAGSVTIDGSAHTGVSGGAMFDDPAYAGAQDRLDVELQGGVSSVTVSAPGAAATSGG